MSETISSMIWTEINEIQKMKDNFDAETLSEKLISLSVLYASLTSHITEMESDYYKEFTLILNAHPEWKTNRAEVEIKSSDTYKEYRKATNLEKALIEIIRSCKKFIKIKENEQEISY